MSFIDRFRCHMAVEFCVCVDEDHCKLLTLYWLRKLHKRPNKSLFMLILVHVLLPSRSFMRTKHLSVLIHIRNKGETGAVKMIKPSSIFTDNSKAMLLLKIYFVMG